MFVNRCLPYTNNKRHKVSLKLFSSSKQKDGTSYCRFKLTSFAARALKHKRTSAVSPFLVFIIVQCYRTPQTVVIHPGAAVVSTAFVNEREGAALAVCCSRRTRS